MLFFLTRVKKGLALAIICRIFLMTKLNLGAPTIKKGVKIQIKTDNN